MNVIKMFSDMFNKISFCAFCLLIMMISSGSHALSLVAKVDRSSIAINETLRLVVNADENADQEIDFEQLSLQFDIINQQRSSQRSIINGKVSANTQWVLILAPKETGQLLIPSFEYKNVFSSAISIDVSAVSDTQTNDNSSDVFIEAKVDKTQVYVQEQVLLTLRLYYKISLSSYEAEDIKPSNTAIELLTENNFQTEIEGQKYNVFEKIYSLHPQSSGRLSIPRQTWRLEKSSRRFFGHNTNPYLYARTEPVTIDVMPIPSNSTAKYWLPSTAVTLDGQWKQSLLQATIGEPLNYQLNLQANGLSSSQLPAIELPSVDGLTIYGDQPSTDDNKTAKGIIGSRVSHFAIIPQTIGEITLPSLTLRWWDINSDEERTITIPKQTILVSQSQVSASEALPSLPNLPASTAELGSSQNGLWVWQLISASLALLCCILAYGVYYFSRYKAKPSVSTNHAGNKTHTSTNQLLADIRNSAEQQDWQQLRQSLIEWGRQVSDNPKLGSLYELGQQIPSLNLLLQQLDNHLYGQKQDDSWNPSPLISAIKQYKPQKQKRQQQQLQPLY